MRGTTGVIVNDPLGWGDKLTLTGIGSGASLWDASFDYNIMLGTRGMRAGISGSRTRYFLGGDYQALDATGIDDMGSAYITMPMIRSLKFDLNMALSYTHKELHDNVGLIDEFARSALDNVTLTFSGDWSDALFDGAYNTYSLAYTHGFLHLNDAASFQTDQAASTGLDTEGNFDKLTFNYQRQQTIWGGFTLLSTLSGQYGLKNLSSAEKFFLGGPAGVRAYSVGEAGGDSGALASAELRYTYPVAYLTDARATLGGFYDAGWVRINANPIAGSGANQEELGGPGVHAGLSRPGIYNIDISWAFQAGGRASSVQPDKTQHLWLQAAFDF